MQLVSEKKIEKQISTLTLPFWTIIITQDKLQYFNLINARLYYFQLLLEHAE